MVPHLWLAVVMTGSDWQADGEVILTPTALAQLVARNRHWYLAPLGPF